VFFPTIDGPPYSGYFNAIVAPAALSPLAGAAFVESIGLPLVFAASAVAAVLQFLTVPRLQRLELRGLRHDPRLEAQPSPAGRTVPVALQGVGPGAWPQRSGSASRGTWYFAFGANMHNSAFRERRNMPRWNGGRDASRAYRLRFNLEDRPRGRAAPVNISPDPDAEVVGVLYKITRKDLVWLDCTEGVAGRRYRQLCTEAEDRQGNRTACVTYIADGNATDGRPSLRYLTTLRGGTRAQELPGQWIRLLEDVKHAE
jgi:cation transport regulator ChaC